MLSLASESVFCMYSVANRYSDVLVPFHLSIYIVYTIYIDALNLLSRYIYIGQGALQI